MWSQQALGSITTNKASGGDGIPVELFQILWCRESAALNIPANLENSAVATALEKVSFHSNPKERQCQRMLFHSLKVKNSGVFKKKKKRVSGNQENI